MSMRAFMAFCRAAGLTDLPRAAAEARFLVSAVAVRSGAPAMSPAFAPSSDSIALEGSAASVDPEDWRVRVARSSSRVVFSVDARDRSPRFVLLGAGSRDAEDAAPCSVEEAGRTEVPAPERCVSRETSDLAEVVPVASARSFVGVGAVPGPGSSLTGASAAGALGMSAPSPRPRPRRRSLTVFLSLARQSGQF
jgi:hypothetical protein